MIEHCKECVDLLGDYVEGHLSPAAEQALEAHLSECMPCITFVRTYKATRRLCRKALTREMPSELMGALSSFLGKHVPGFTCPTAGESAEGSPPSGTPDIELKKG